MNIPTWAPVLAAAVTPVFLLLQAYRRFSGQIATTDAAKLWDESTRMRQEYRARISELNKLIDFREGRIAELEKRNEALEKENNNLLNVITKLEKDLRRRGST